MRSSHGHARRPISKTYQAWKNMKKRCYRSSSNRFQHYGGRGIVVCDRWKVFENFLEDMGEAPKDKSLDRIDNNGNYEPGNCRWATTRQQFMNRRVTRFIQIGKMRLTIIEAAERFGIKYKSLFQAIQRGSSGSSALARLIEDKKTKSIKG
jgi:hypothetical protein